MTRPPNGSSAFAVAIACSLFAFAAAEPGFARTAVPAKSSARPRPNPSQARVAFSLAGRLSPPAVGRRDNPLTAEEGTAKQIEKLLRGPLRSGVTAVYVADAKTGAPLFAVNADDALNPASNVKMLSTAAALELMGPEFRYSTRLLGALPDASGAIRGDLYLLGSYDPTLIPADLDDLAAQLAARGVRQLEGNVIVGPDPERDGVPKSVIPIDIIAGEPKQAPLAIGPPGFDFVSIRVTATTAKAPGRPRLSYTAESVVDARGLRRIALTIGGTIGQGGVVTYPLRLKDRSAVAAHLVRSALRGRGILVTGDVAVADLDQYLAARGGVPAPELARHDSAKLADIVARINKLSVNWLADRVIMTAAGMARGETPSMTAGLAAMHHWLAERAHLDKTNARFDNGSGLSYATRITARDLVSIVRSAAGFAEARDPKLATAWLSSLAVAGVDGTLVGRLRDPELRGRIRAKTGTLSTAIALSGVLDLDPERPLAFAIVTNGDRPLRKVRTRNAHDQIVTALCSYLIKTTKNGIAPQAPVSVEPPIVPENFEGADLEGELDREPETPSL